MNKNPSLIEAKVSQPGEDFLTESSKSPASMAFFCKTKSSQEKPESRRATDGTRTRDLHLGKVAYYQLYYYRISTAVLIASTVDSIHYDIKNVNIFFLLFFHF